MIETGVERAAMSQFRCKRPARSAAARQ